MKTRRFFGWVAMATMVLSTGCSNDEVVENFSPENAIEFGTYVGRDAQSRAHIITETELANEGFGVFAYYTGTSDFGTNSKPNFMYNEEVKGTITTTDEGESVTTWSYSPVKYWPNNNGDKVSFFAYAPYATETNGLELSANTAAGNPTVTYEMTVDDESLIKIPTGDNVDGQVDLLYLTNVEKVTDMTKQKVGEKVEFVFGHALSRVSFAAKVLVDEVNGDANDGENNDAEHTLDNIAEGTTITINSVKLTGKLYTKGTLDLVTGKWENESQSTEVSYYLDNANFVENSNVFSESTVETEDLLNKDDSYIMLFPQELNTDNTITITVDYDVVTKDESLDGGESKINNVITTAPFYLSATDSEGNAVTGFEQGKAVKFVLHIGMTSVKLSATVGEWDETTTDIVVNVPNNKE